ncbi:MAG: ABC-F family ATP-binding cassette domain-containing protein [Ruminococcaceae bacterium]|nr:ABC-F family ATP-binding cassette domain-containing protein [Oscillospiraceae bacterium]
MILEVKDLLKTFSGEVILENINFKIEDNDRIGLIGANGCGKSTLLNMLTENLSYDEGEIIYHNKEIGYLKQNPEFETDKTIIDEVRSVFCDLLSIEKELKEIYNTISVTKDEKELNEINKKYAKLQTYFEAKDGYNIEVKINTVLNGMGFSDKDYNMRVNNLSGGEKTRLALCKLLLKEPALLILDEPTNHLDFKTLKWLEDYLLTYKGAILMVSHDRYFLDKTVTSIFEIYKGNLKRYQGNYTQFAQIKKNMISFLQKEYEKQQNEIESLKDYIAKNKVRASTAKSAKSREKALERLELIENPKEYLKTISLNFEFDYEPSFELLEVENLSVNIESTPLFNNTDFSVKRGEKIAIVGANGIGKTTFLKALMNKAEYSGKIKWGKNLRISYFEQENHSLNLNNTLLKEIMDKTDIATELEARNVLGSLLLSGEDVFKQVKMLSGGEKAKLKFAIMKIKKGNILIMDEPTNHLDLSSKEVLDESLNDYNGTIIMVSHDRYLLNKIPTKIAELSKDGFTIYEGNYDYYLENKIEVAKEPVIKKETKEKESYYRSKKDRAEEVRISNLIKKTEKEIEELEEQITTLTKEISDENISSDYELLSKKCEELDKTKELLNEKYNFWEELNM